MSLVFEWDFEKAESNLQKHGVGLQEAASTFADLLSITVDDPDHRGEMRYVQIGISDHQRILVVAFVERGDNIRVINVRIATRHERRTYEEDR